MWVPFLRSFPGHEAHENFSSGGPKWGVLGGGQKVYVEIVNCSVLSLTRFALRGRRFPLQALGSLMGALSMCLNCWSQPADLNCTGPQVPLRV